MSKSVKLSRKAAKTGSRKNSAMSTTAGRMNSRAARALSASNLMLLVRRDCMRGIRRARRVTCHQPAPLVEYGVHVPVHHRARARFGHAAPDRRLRLVDDLAGDVLPLRHLGRGAHPVQLHPECPRVLIGLEP